MVTVPESHAIEKTFGLMIGELQGPGFAGIRGFVDARLFAGAGAEQVGKISAKGFHVAKVEGFGSWYLGRLPRISVVGAAKIGSMSPACPSNFVGKRADATKVFSSIGFLGCAILR